MLSAPILIAPILIAQNFKIPLQSPEALKYRSPEIPPQRPLFLAPSPCVVPVMARVFVSVSSRLCRACDLDETAQHIATKEAFFGTCYSFF